MRKRIFTVMLLVLLLLTSATPVWARAGGGGGGGSSGGGSSSHSGSGPRSYHSHNNSGRNRSTPAELVTVLFMQGMMFLTFTGGGTYLLVWKARKAKIRSRKAMKRFSKMGRNWNAKEVQKQVEDAYYQIQECWRRMDVNYGAAYLSPDLQTEFDSKIQWMQINNEEVIQKRVRLLKAMPVFVEDQPGEDQDIIWYLIQGRMKGYYVDRDSREIVRGSSEPETFIEYWKFVCINGHWVLDKIRQEDEMDIDSFEQQ